VAVTVSTVIWFGTLEAAMPLHVLQVQEDIWAYRQTSNVLFLVLFKMTLNVTILTRCFANLLKILSKYFSDSWLIFDLIKYNSKF